MVQGAVRRIHIAPPAAAALVGDAIASGSAARVCVLFASGAFGVWELDARSELRVVQCALILWQLSKPTGPGSAEHGG